MGVVRIGLTGGIASGKSTVARMFKGLGAELIDADRIAHQVIKKGTGAYKKIIKKFGKVCLDQKGEINRKYLGEMIFNDPEKRRVLNAIVHPDVFKKEKEEERKISKKNRNAIIIYDIPLLIETGSHLKMDKVILVHVKREKQIERLMNRNRLTREESLKRVRAQFPFYQKKKLADYLINGDIAGGGTEKRVKNIFEKILREYGINR
jgi:dephospho-CoA kinase